ncbi:tetratricopeptide repeat-containing sensor histidine kinase [Flavobacterium caeni]|uniref:histidine kinase n=1 Tax=Flavobacterium caeni TaxID=490189 RepID=A0A1G5IIK5_9FLAO|nr:histidine kinase dimerization/phosphoacceptor domain -containing protein [Flavobacterium caeni]SCY75389.1 Two-component sensor histidine kinase, contains HisKA and HATPase domains [Flavobacterium caeni]
MRNGITIFFLFVVSAAFSQSEQWLDKAWDYTSQKNDSALIYIRRANETARKTSNRVLEAKAMEAEGLYYELAKSDYSKATGFYMKAIALAEKYDLDYLPNLYHTMGVLFHTTDNYEKADEYYKLTLPLAEQKKDTDLLVKCMINLASSASSQKKFAEAESVFKKALQYNNDFEVNRVIYANMANLYMRQGAYRKAMPYLLKGIATNTENGKSGSPLEYAYLLDGMIALQDKKGLDTMLIQSRAQLLQNPSRRHKSILLKSMGQGAALVGDFKTAVDLKDQYIALYDSIKAEQRDHLVYELETKYQTEKQQAEIDQTEKEKRQLSWLAGLAALVILVLGWLVYSNLKKKKSLALKTAQLEKLVDEKNLLLRETHHRVKNSFQIVSSLLYLQSENIKDKEAALAVKEAQNRVKSMVLIHQKLYSKDQLVGVNAKEYLEDLVRDIIDNHSAHHISVNATIEPLVLGIDTITPIGLIANELITNILKHAFDAQTTQPTIWVSFAKTDDTILFSVADNGKGMGTPREDSFGIKLIRSLSKKLKADVDFKTGDGVTVDLKIRKFELL